MRGITLKQWVLAVLCLLMPWAADAAGLGRLSVLSALGQPLNAEIDLVSVGKDELATLSARLASPDAYKQANLQYGPALVGLRLSIERRPGGQPYIKVASPRPVNEPFIDLMVEITWASGRITREYTALIDPPGFAPTPSEFAPVAVPETRPAPEIQAPAVAAVPAPAPAPAPARKRPAVTAPTASSSKEYGPIKRGETLFNIAGDVKPEGVTLEQMLVGLYRSNPDAFENNMNRMKTGKILRVPDKGELSAVPQQEAKKEYRAQVADWNAYRRKLADAAGMAESRPAASGRITARVEDRAASGEAKDVVRLSKGEPPKGAGGKPGTVAARVRALEEEANAREKTLSEANERIAQLEKTIKDMQRLLEIKSPGMAAAQQKAETKPPGQKPETPRPAPKPEVAAAAKPDAAKPAVTAATPAAEVKKDDAKAAAPADKPAVEAKAQPKPKPKVVAPPPEPDLIGSLLDEPLYLAAGGAVILLGLGLWMARRRRSRPVAEDEEPVRSAPTLAKDMAAAAGVAASPLAPAQSAEAGIPAAPVDDEVDPLAEAEVYIAYGRDAQAEEILKEALARKPNREDVQLKLLEIYAARKDKAGFNGVAGGFHKLTGGQGGNWLKVAAMGYALDPGNRLYEAGKDVPVAEPLAGSPTSTDLDFDLGLSPVGLTATDITLDPDVTQQAQMERTAIIDSGAMQAMASEAAKAEEAKKAEETAAAPLMPDFRLDLPPAEAPTATDISLDVPEPAPAAADSNVMDFNIELPKIEAPKPAAEPEVSAPQGHDPDAGLDFKLDIGDISLNLDDQPPADVAVEQGEKDAHWYDVQTKFDLAKAYQEMGDKDGAREILQEVIKEGDAEQQTAAKKLLETLN